MCPNVHLPAATKRLHVSGCQCVRRVEGFFYPSILPIKGIFLDTCFLFSEFWKISGSGRSTKEENSLAKAATSQFIAQVIILQYWIISNNMWYFFFHAKQFNCSLISSHWFLIQTYLRRHCGKKAKTTSSFWKGDFFCARQTSLSDTSLRGMWVVFSRCCWLLFCLMFTVIMFLILEPALPSNQVQGSQSCHLHEGPERGVPAGEDPPRSRPADLLPAWWTDEESVCLSWGWIRESFSFSWVSYVCSAADPAASDICKALNFCLSFSCSAEL